MTTITDQTKETIRRHYRNGWTIKSLETMFGINQKIVTEILGPEVRRNNQFNRPKIRRRK